MHRAEGKIHLRQSRLSSFHPCFTFLRGFQEETTVEYILKGMFGEKSLTKVVGLFAD